MINLGKVKPGDTIFIPFDSFDGGTGASITMTGLAVGDIKIYKDGGTTERASTSGFTLLDTDGIDFDGITGIHGVSIDLSDNTTAAFYEAGSRYFVVIDSITVDAQTVSFVAAMFEIGYESAILNTTIATLASQVSFTLTAGSGDDDAYNGCVAIIHDIASAVQVAIGYVSNYVGSTLTVTLAADPGIFTMAAGDNISLFIPANMYAIAGNITNAANVGTAGSNYSATRGLSGTALPAAAADNAGGLPISDAGGLDMDAILADTADMQPKLGTISDLGGGATIGANLSDINTAISGLNDLSAAEVNAEVDTALADYDGPTYDELLAFVQLLSRSDAAINTDRSTELAAINTNEGSGAGDYDNQTDGQEALRDNVGTNGAALVLAKTTNITGFNDVSTAEVNAEVDTALADYDGPTYDELLAFIQLLARSDAAINTDRSTELAAINTNEGSGAGDYDNQTDSEEAVRDHIGDGTNLTEAGGTGDQLTAIDLPDQTMNITGDITGNLSGSVGSVTGNVGGNVAGSIGSLDTQAKADVNAEADTALSDYDGPTRAELTSDINSVLAQLPADAPIEGTADSGTTLTMVDAARTEADTDYWKGSWILFTSGNIAGQVRLITAFTPATDTITFTPATTQAVSTNTYRIIPAAQIEEVLLLTGHTPQTGDNFARLGAPAGGSIAADIAENQTDLNTILADTNELQTDWVDGGRLDLIIDAILADTNELQTDDVPGLIAALNNISTAQVNAEVVDALSVDTYAEPTGVPAATVTLAVKLGYLYMALRNKVTVDATDLTFFDDGGTSEWKKALSDDGSTYTEAEAATP